MKTVRWIGHAMGSAFEFLGVSILAGWTFRDGTNLIAAVSIIGTGAYFVIYAFTGRFTFWSQGRQ